jgi:hypothetical protein
MLYLRYKALYSPLVNHTAFLINLLNVGIRVHLKGEVGRGEV